MAKVNNNQHTAFVGLGANLGDAQRTVEKAIDILAAEESTSHWAASRLYRSAPVDAQGPDFINAVMRIQTCLTPIDLLNRLQEIEHCFGRNRPHRNAPRTLDCDLILYDTIQMNTRDLTLPHPRLHERAFVLQPLCDLCADIVIPRLGKAADLLIDTASQRIAPVTISAMRSDSDLSQ